MGIELRVVEQAIGDASAFQIDPTSPPVRVLRKHRFGGIVDSHRRIYTCRIEDPAYQGSPRVWYASEPQEEILLRAASGKSPKPKTLILGAMGAGKTNVLAKAGILLCLYLISIGYATRANVAIGATAPTQERRDIILRDLREACDDGWYRFVAKKCNFIVAGSVAIELRATKEQSTSTGSPIQGQNWAAHIGDEYQDQVHAHPHVLARGRSAPNGEYQQFVTVTAKDSMRYRKFRDDLPSEFWDILRLEGRTNAFVWPQHWERMKAEMSDREYRMKVLAQDVGPERAVYPAWQREVNLMPVPLIGAKDVTARILGGSGPRFEMLIGHDPGVLRNCSVMLKAYELPKRRKHVWFVVDELETLQTTTEQHGLALRDHLQNRWGLNLDGEDEPRVLVRNDPWSERDAGTHRSVYHQLRALGFIVLAADHTAKGEGRKAVPLHASVEMVNRLLRSAGEETRLYIAQDINTKRPRAQKTCDSIELSEWDPWGQREMSRKDDKDKDPTDFTSALRYALWNLEKSRAGEREDRGDPRPPRSKGLVF